MGNGISKGSKACRNTTSWRRLEGFRNPVAQRGTGANGTTPWLYSPAVYVVDWSGGLSPLGTSNPDTAGLPVKCRLWAGHSST